MQVGEQRLPAAQMRTLSHPLLLLTQPGHRQDLQPLVPCRAIRRPAKARALVAERGFEIADAPGGLATAFRASYGSGPLKIGVCAEYDALPEIGHACGHNIIAAAAVGAALALADVADELGRRFGAEARAKVLAGVTTIEEVLKVTRED